MSEMDELTTLLNKSTVSQLREQCSQRNLPQTPAKKSDLVGRLVLFLKDNPEDELNKPQASEGGEALDDGEEVGMDTTEEPSMGNGENMSAEGKDQVEHDEEKEDATKTTDEITGEDNVEMKEETKKSEGQADDDKVKKNPWVRRPVNPDSKQLSTYRTIDSRRRTLVICPVGVKDLAREDVQQFMSGEVENVNYHLNTLDPGPDLSKGHINIIFNTWELTTKKMEEFPMYKDGLVVRRLGENITTRTILDEVFPEDAEKRNRHGQPKGGHTRGVPAEKRTICAHFVPEGTSDETLRSLFPEVKGFVWARNDDGVYQGMVFLEYETIETTTEQWNRLVKEKMEIGDTRLWFHTVMHAPGKNQQSPLLSEDARRNFNLRKEQLKMEIGNQMLSNETLQTLRQNLKKVEDALEADRVETHRLKMVRKKANRKQKMEAKTNEKEGKNESRPSPAKPKTDLKTNNQGKMSNNQQKKGGNKPKQQQQQKQHQQQQQQKRNRRRPNYQERPNYTPQRSPGYSRWGNRQSPNFPNRSPGAFMPQANLGGMGMNQGGMGMNQGGMGMNQGFGQQQMGSSASTRANPQATANAVSLLVGLSSILGGNMRRQSGDGGGFDDREQYGGYQDRHGEWVGSSTEEPMAKRGRYSGGGMY